MYVLLCLQVSFAMFGVYVITGNELTTSKALVALSLINIIRFPLIILPSVIVSFVQVDLGFLRLKLLWSLANHT